jgi:hypothetical protein
MPASFSYAPHSCLRKQRGAALMVMLVILVVGVAAMLVTSLNSATLLSTRNNNTSGALAQAKEALIGDSAAQSTVSSAGYLLLPDLGFSTNLAVLAEGFSPLNFTGNNTDLSLIGKIPWKKLSLPVLRDGSGECLWYIVSGRFKNTPPPTSIFNWDTLGQIDVIDGSGNNIANNVAALIVAPGRPIDGQSHSLADPIYTQCGGNYDAQNYLDSYNLANAVSGQVNYFASSTNNRLAPNTSNKQFVMTSNTHYNDQFIFITVDDIFRPIIHRSDFVAQITTLMNDPYFKSVTISGTKGTSNVVCSSLTGTANQTFCTNWQEMLLIKQIPAMMSPYTITIDGVTVTPSNCLNNRLLIFAGQRTTTQTRITASNKFDPANYLEVPNLSAFTGTSGTFVGTSTFSSNNSSADLLKCL